MSDKVASNWKVELKKIQKCPQRQDSLNNQLTDLIQIANRFGFYDAADYLNLTVKQPNNGKASK